MKKIIKAVWSWLRDWCIHISVVALILTVFGLLSTVVFSISRNEAEKAATLKRLENQKNPALSANVANLKNETNIADPTVAQIDRAAGIVRYGSLIFYFPFTGPDMGNALKKFLDRHLELEFAGEFHDVVKKNDSSGGNYDSDYGITAGHFIIFREKPKPVLER